MLAKVADALPAGEGFLYEPKWDGFRAIVFCGATDVYIQSRDLRPLDRYFPDLHAVFRARLPGRVRHRRGDRDCHAAGARLRRAAAAAASGGVARGEAGSSDAGGFVGFDLLAAEGVDLRVAAPERAPAPPRSAARRERAADLSDPDDPRSRARGRVARTLRGRGPRRRDRQAGRRPSTSQASAR